MNGFPDLSNTPYTTYDWDQGELWCSDSFLKSNGSSTGDTPDFISDDYINSNESYGSGDIERTEDAEEREDTERTREPDQIFQLQSQEPPAKPKRRRENRYKNAPPAVISRRRAQNRASQRAVSHYYRERKDQRIKDLEGKLAQATKDNEMLTQTLNNLQREYSTLKNQRFGVEGHQTQFWPHGVSWEPQSISSTIYYSDPTNHFTA
ncbi:hypothetical protein GQX73_g8638 [Xylaria multiplex]|uniref:Putative transcription factor kapC n=1 Tax=Xylaria multiplex TaxID=323545 RepID=A0A7C8MKU3_9PEZI|nr:hypothetical protein GQX73_g8638 [Xylaria multiplex]